MTNHIHHPDAWENGKRSAIKRNATTTRLKKWLPLKDHQRLNDWLCQTGEFADVVEDDFNITPHPLTVGIFAGGFGDLLISFRDNIFEWGNLSEKQSDVVRKALARKEQWVLEAVSKREAEKASRTNAHIGKVGERQWFEGVIRFVTSGEGQFGTWFLTVVDTPEGTVCWFNRFEDAEKGDLVEFMAAVKKHDERDGEKQTSIIRATQITVTKGDDHNA
tara:strand:+ start:458 stop:1114 length:657 start_codon:yes stop_codon:yes gene_type:complete